MPVARSGVSVPRLADPGARFAPPSSGDTALSPTEGRLLWAITVVPVAIVLVDADCRVVRANEPACDLLGHRDAELVGRSAADLVHRADRGRFVTELELLTAGAIERIRREVRVITPANRDVWAELHVRTVIASPDDSQVCAVAILDVCDRPLEHELHRFEQAGTLTDLLKARQVIAGVGGQAAALAATLIDAITVSHTTRVREPITVSDSSASVRTTGAASDATRLTIGAGSAMHEVNARQSWDAAPSAGACPPRLHIDVRAVLRAVAELGSAGLSLVAWELGTDTITVAPAWSAAVRDRLLERVHYESRNQEWQYALSGAAHKRLRRLERARDVHNTAPYNRKSTRRRLNSAGDVGSRTA